MNDRTKRINPKNYVGAKQKIGETKEGMDKKFEIKDNIGMFSDEMMGISIEKTIEVEKTKLTKICFKDAQKHKKTEQQQNRFLGK